MKSKYYRLTPIRRVPGKGNQRWLFKCDCGNIKEIRLSHVKAGKIKSCGCYHDEVSQKRDKTNKLKIIDNYVIGVLTNTGNNFIFDKDDYEKVEKYTWYENNGGYIYHKFKDNKSVLLHRYILNATNNNLVIDHINNNSFDNRKNNLRLCSQQDNMLNINNNKQRGVCWDNRRRKWRVYIQYKKRPIHLGYFDNKEEAANIRKEAERKYFPLKV